MGHTVRVLGGHVIYYGRVSCKACKKGKKRIA